ncbi:MAG: hypothetical protein K2M20_06500, partial [Lachnospiraceae bacterium]|nr:hypothetical protein [Lachnospiraceae bacterium]
MDREIDGHFPVFRNFVEKTRNFVLQAFPDYSILSVDRLLCGCVPCLRLFYDCLFRVRLPYGCLSCVRLFYSCLFRVRLPYGCLSCLRQPQGCLPSPPPRGGRLGSADA